MADILWPSEYVLVLTFVAVSLWSSLATAAESDRWQVRGGVYFANPDLGNGVIPGIPGASTELSDDAQPGVSVTWFATDQLGVEFFISPPFEFDLLGAGTLNGVGAVGRLKSLTPTLIGQWYFGNSQSRVRPYVGAGIAYTIFYDEETTAAFHDIVGTDQVEFAFANKWSWIGQAGIDVRLTGRWLANIMLAYLPPDTTAKLSTPEGSVSGHVTIDAWVTTVGVGYRF
jgi:outer membrane protein